MNLGRRLQFVVGPGGRRAAEELADRVDRAAVAVAENQRLGRDLAQVVDRLEHDVYTRVARHLEQGPEQGPDQSHGEP